MIRHLYHRAMVRLFWWFVVKMAEKQVDMVVNAERISRGMKVR